MNLGIEGRVALITGASRGIGRGIAEGLAAEGVNLVLTARNEARLDETASDIRRAHRVDVRTIAADMSDAATPARLAAAGAIDILVNNANTPSGGSLEGLDDAQWMRNWAVKPFGYIRMMRAFAPVLRANGQGGAIVNMIGQINQVATNKAIYSAASCAALTTVTQALAHELAQSNIRIVGVSAWVVNTETVIEGYQERARARFGDASRWRELMSHLPFARAAEPGEIGDLVAFLVSERARYLSGQVINLDGGYIVSSVPTLASGALAHE